MADDQWFRNLFGGAALRRLQLGSLYPAIGGGYTDVPPAPQPGHQLSGYLVPPEVAPAPVFKPTGLQRGPRTASVSEMLGGAVSGVPPLHAVVAAMSGAPRREIRRIQSGAAAPAAALPALALAPTLAATGQEDAGIPRYEAAVPASSGYSAGAFAQRPANQSRTARAVEDLMGSGMSFKGALQVLQATPKPAPRVPARDQLLGQLMDLASQKYLKGGTEAEYVDSLNKMNRAQTLWDLPGMASISRQPVE